MWWGREARTAIDVLMAFFPGETPYPTPALLFSSTPSWSSHIQIQAYCFSISYSPTLLDLVYGGWSLRFIFTSWRCMPVQHTMRAISKSHTSCVSGRSQPLNILTPLLSCVDTIIHLFFRWENQGSKMRVTYPGSHIPPGLTSLNPHSLIGMGGEAVEPFNMGPNWQTQSCRGGARGCNLPGPIPRFLLAYPPICNRSYNRLLPPWMETWLPCLCCLETMS